MLALLPLLASLLLASSPRAIASDSASGAVLSFASARDGGVFREPRVEIARPKLDVRAGDVLEYGLAVPAPVADRVGVELVTADGRRVGSVARPATSSWTRVRVPLDELAGASIDRVELVARGHLAAEVAFQVDDVLVTRTGESANVIFKDQLATGVRSLRDDERGAGVRVLEAAAGFEGARARFTGQTIVDPWNAYDLARLRASSDGNATSAGGPRGDVLVGPAIPMRFAAVAADERTAVIAAGQRLAFDPIDGGRFFSVYLAVSTSDGQALTTRGFACGDAGERQPIDFVVPARGVRAAGSFDLGGCALIELPIASEAPLRAFELPREPRLLVHAVTFVWRKDGLTDPRFRLAWFEAQARAARELTPRLRELISRYVANRRLGTIFSNDRSEVAEERALFEALLDDDVKSFESRLAKVQAVQVSRGIELKVLRVAIEDPVDTRDHLDVRAVDPESLLRRLADGLQPKALVLEGDPAEARQLPQFLAALGVEQVLLSQGASLSRWSAPDNSSVFAVTPTWVVRDAREFGDLPWSTWIERARAGGVDAEILFAVGAGAEERAEAQSILDAFRSLDAVPRMRRATVETFVSEALRRLKGVVPDAAPALLRPLAEASSTAGAAAVDPAADASRTSPADTGEVVSSARRAAQALRQLETFHAVAFLDGAPSIRDRLTDAWRSLARLEGDGAIAAARAGARTLIDEAHELTTRQLDVLARGASTLGAGTPIVVFNSLPYARGGLLRLEESSAVVTTSTGAKAPSQATWDGARVFRVDVPAFGYEVVHGVRGDELVAPRKPTGLVVADGTARNAKLGFTLDRDTGALTSLTSEPDALEMLSQPLTFLDASWTVRSASFVESGPLRAVARVTAERAARDRATNTDGAAASESASTETASIEIVLEADANRIEVTCRVRARSVPPIVARVPMRHAIARALVGVPFASSMAAPGPGGSAARHRLYDWIAGTDGERGVAILGGDVGVVRVEPRVLSVESSNVDADGVSVTRFALLPFRQGAKRAGLAAQAAEYATPFVAATTDVHPGARPPRHSFASLSCSGSEGRSFEGAESGVQLSALQSSPDGDAWTIRLVETTGLAREVVLSFERPLFGAERVDWRGEKAGDLRVEDGRVRFLIGPARVETIRVRLRP